MLTISRNAARSLLDGFPVLFEAVGHVLVIFELSSLGRA